MSGGQRYDDLMGLGPVKPPPVIGALPLPRAAVTGTRNGLPDPVGYQWRSGAAERDAEVAARVEAARAAVRLAHGVADEEAR
jgi:hypothetical protein